MSDLGAVPAPAPEAGKPTGFFANLIDIYFSPAEGYANILRKPAFLVPLAFHLVLSLAFTAVWLKQVDAKAFMHARIEESGRMDKIPPDRLAQVIDQQAKFLPTISWVAGTIAPPLVVTILAGLFLFIFRFFFAADTTFKQSMTVVASTFAATALLVTPLMLAVLAMKNDWTIPPQEALQANLTLLLEKQTTPKPLYTLAGSVDLMSFWTFFLLTTGYAAASKRSWSQAMWGIAIPWAIWVAGRVVLSFIF